MPNIGGPASSRRASIAIVVKSVSTLKYCYAPIESCRTMPQWVYLEFVIYHNGRGLFGMRKRTEFVNQESKSSVHEEVSRWLNQNHGELNYHLNKLCPICNNIEENPEHILFGCAPFQKGVKLHEP